MLYQKMVLRIGAFVSERQANKNSREGIDNADTWDIIGIQRGHLRLL